MEARINDAAAQDRKAGHRNLLAVRIRAVMDG
jgi:hypothetical protein